MNELEEYGIRDVGFVHKDTSDLVPIVGEMAASGMMSITVAGQFKGRMHNFKRPGKFENGAELYITDDVYIWFDEVIEAQ